MTYLVPVILAGGSGTRLWPLSRQQYPKQFLKLFGDHTMLQQTLQRLIGLEGLADPIVVCNEDHRFIVAEQLQEIGLNSSIILEPLARNTAPAIALAAFRAKELYGNAILLVLPADHLIGEVEHFQNAIKNAAELAQTGSLTTFGVVPTRVETGYGYIETEVVSGSLVCAVKRFVEKPDEEAAQQYIEAGNYLWNSGMFVFSADCYLDALKKFEPDCMSASEQAYANKDIDADFIRIAKESFSMSPSISIDYAVMEKSDNIACIPLDAGWSDVGCWKSYWETADKDSDGNIKLGDVVSLETRNTLAFTQDKLLSTLGVEDLVIVNTQDAVLVVHKNYAQAVKHVIDELKQNKRNEHINHRKVNRPWGFYDSVDTGERFQVKRIQVKPGASLSLQMHRHRAEHWVVVNGTALVQKEDQEIILHENESTFIPQGTKHRLANPTDKTLEIIEVQSGSYLGEDDIVRFEDVYGRQ